MKKIIMLLFLLLTLMSYGAGQKITVPRGTSFMIKTIDNIDISQGAGHIFSGTLEGDIVINNKVVVKSGSKVYGSIVDSLRARRLVGRSKLSVQLDKIMVNNSLIHITTNQLAYEGDKGSGADTVGKTARSAAVGGLINGGDGAKVGAEVGLGLSLLTKGASIGIPAGTYLNFNFSQDVLL